MVTTEIGALLTTTCYLTAPACTSLVVTTCNDTELVQGVWEVFGKLLGRAGRTSYVVQDYKPTPLKLLS